MRRPIDAVVFDLDGVLVDTEPWWFAARVEVAMAFGRAWSADDERTVKGANSREWAERLAAHLGRPDTATTIERAVVETMLARYASERAPVIAAGVRAARRLSGRLPLAVASSAPPSVIAAALAALGIRERFAVLVSSDEVGVGKPDPAVYLEAARRLGIPPAGCLVIEDADAGVAAAIAAGMRVVLVPATGHPPGEGSRNAATLVLDSVDALDDDRLRELEGR